MTYCHNYYTLDYNNPKTRKQLRTAVESYKLYVEAREARHKEQVEKLEKRVRNEREIAESTRTENLRLYDEIRDLKVEAAKAAGFTWWVKDGWLVILDPDGEQVNPGPTSTLPDPRPLYPDGIKDHVADHYKLWRASHA